MFLMCKAHSGCVDRGFYQWEHSMFRDENCEIRPDLEEQKLKNSRKLTNSKAKL